MRRAIRNLQRGLIGLLLFVGILLGAGWVCFPLLVAPVANAFLAPFEVTVSRIDARRPGLSRLHIDRLEFHHRNGRVRATDLTLRWQVARSPSAPLTLAAIDIRRLEGAQTLSSNDDTERPKAATVSAPRPGQWFDALGNTVLDIVDLDIATTLEGQLLRLDGRLHSARGQASFEGTLRTDQLEDSVQITLAMDRTEQLALTLGGRNDPALRFEGRFEDTSVASERRLALGGDASIDLGAVGKLLDRSPPWPEGTLSARLDIEVDADGRVAVHVNHEARGAVTVSRGEDGGIEALAMAFALDGPVTLVRHGDGTLESFGSLRFAYGAGHPDGRVDGHIRLSDLAGTWQTPALGIHAEGRLEHAAGGTYFDARAQVALRESGSLLQLDRGAFLALREARWGKRELGDLLLVATRPFEAPVETLSAGALAAPLELALDLTDSAGLTATTELTLGPDGALSLAVAHVDLPLGPSGLVGRMAGADWPFRAGRVELTGQLSRSTDGRVTGRLSPRLVGVGLDHAGHRLRDARGTVDLILDGDRLDLREIDLELGRVTLSATADPVSLEDSRVGGHGRLHFSAGPDAGERGVSLDRVSLDRFSLSPTLAAARISQGALTIDTADVSGTVSGTLEHYAAELTATAAEADFGVTLRSLRCSAQVNSGHAIEFSDCGGAALGGSIALVRGRFDPVSGDGYLPLGLSRIDLAAVLALMQDPALGGTGTLDGSIPLRLAGGRPSVSEGWLAARPPGGTLAYATRPALLASMEQPMVKLALAAVRDLRYEQLESRVVYDDDGTLVLAVSLLGSNPEIEGGRPINLNLNVNQNLLGLLESLRLADDIEGRLQRVQP